MEIRKSKEILEGLTGKEVRYLAYPYGSYNEATVSIVKEAGFAAAFSTQNIPLQKAQDPALLGRLPVTNAMDYKTRIR